MGPCLSEGREAYFSKFSNILDILIVIMNIIALFLYFEFHSLSEELEDISVLLLIAVRNLIQLIRVVTFYKNQKEIRVNIKERVNFQKHIQEMKYQSLRLNSNTNQNNASSYITTEILENKHIDNYMLNDF